MSKFEDLTSKIIEKSPSRAKAKAKRLRKGRLVDIKINSFRAKADEKKESKKGVSW